MTRIWAVLALCGASVFAPGVPLATTISVVAATAVGFAAVRLHERAEALALGGAAAAADLLRAARFCDDLAFALCLLGLLYAVH